MLYIAPDTILNQTFQTNLGTDFVCIGYGQNPTSGAIFIVGQSFDAQNNRTVISTHLIKDCKCKGKLPDALIPK